MRPYLIQRGKFQDREDKNRIDSILRFDYMGSSEFECGSLPKSLSEIRANFDDYTYSDIKMSDKTITLFCKVSDREEIVEALKKLSKGEIHTKEYHAFDSYITGKGFFGEKIDFWWDISNNFMFWKKSNDFEKKFKLAIEPIEEKVEKKKPSCLERIKNLFTP